MTEAISPKTSGRHAHLGSLNISVFCYRKIFITRVCVFLLLGNEERRMRFELEEEIGDVETKQENSRATGDDQKTLLSILVGVRR